MLNKQTSRVTLLIDADNLPPVAVDLVFEYLHKSGVQVQVRRAYGGHEKLAGMKDVLRKHAVRAFVNQGKGTTDVALVVDAMDMLHLNALSATVAIVSSDADFAPLALRLREAGMRVICFAKRDNSDADALLRAYDEVIYVDAPQSVEASVVLTDVPVKSVPVKKIGANKTTVATVSKPVTQVTPVAAPVSPAPAAQPVVAVSKPVTQVVPVAALVSSAPATQPVVAVSNPVTQVVPVAVLVSSIPAAQSVAMDDPKTVRNILAALPAWLPNTIMQLNQLGKPLRESGVAKGNKPLHELFRKHPLYFKVLPTTGAAKQIRLLKTPL
jgi:hypothetical protein